jgi:hypothetical protein
MKGITPRSSIVSEIRLARPGRFRPAAVAFSLAAAVLLALPVTQGQELRQLVDFDDDDLVLEPLHIEETDFDAPSVTVVADAVGSDRDNAVPLEAPWTVRGRLERRESRFFELRVDGDP